MARPQHLDFVAPLPIADDAPRPKLVTADAAVTAYPSPVTELQAGLAESLRNDVSHDVHVEKYPFAWTLIGVAVVSVAAWAGIAALIFA